MTDSKPKYWIARSWQPVLVLLVLMVCITQCGSRVEFADEIERQLPEKIDYNYHVKPILSDRCFACHGPDENKREAGLRLDIADSAFAALGENRDHHAIVPGNSKKSTIVERLLSTDPTVKMPPPESNLTISEFEAALITRWIEQGAEYKPHWSFIKPQRPELPSVRKKEWVANPVDRFTLAKMEAYGLEPSEPASKETLIRRVTFDLTGLPPTVEEIDAFLQDNDPNAYEKLVDRLLESPHYGERMASEWLDVARYADSHGYQDDGLRNQWPWRDWVISSFNRNMPYDEFVVWQLGGDLLPNATSEQILATAFNRNHLQSQENGIVFEEYRVEYVADRTNTFGTAFLALSTECARCHDHKYDPISQKEYFQLFAFFNSVNENGQIPYMGESSPTLILTDEEAERKLAFINENIRAQEQKVDPKAETYRAGFEQWKKNVRQDARYRKVTFNGRIGHYALDQIADDDTFVNAADRKKPAKVGLRQTGSRPRMVEGKFGNGVELIGDCFIDMGTELGYFERNEPFSIGIWVKTLKDGVEGPIFSKSGGVVNGFRGYDLMLGEDGHLSASLNHTWPANSIEVRTLEKIPYKEWIHLVLTYDGSSRAEGIRIYLNGKPMEVEIITDHLKRSILGYGKEKRHWEERGNLRIGRRYKQTISDLIVDEFNVFAKKLSPVEVSALFGNPDAVSTFLDAGDDTALLDYYLSNADNTYQRNFEELTKLRGEENEVISALPEIMVMQDRLKPRPTFILARGAYDAPTEQVHPGTPKSIMTFSGQLEPNRLGLARWLIHEDNPLTARVAVNRYWQMIFGKGIVKTSNDFGSQGELPTHPELLDWLAVEFRESGWNVKALLKMLVMSATYRQSSTIDPERREKDPDNTWLSRSPAYRMPAEMIRDNALAASGLLTRTIGGPSVKPYQPPGLWKELATRNAVQYVPDSGANLYRRGLYTIWKRTSPPPSMITFDASDKYVCVVRRQTTSTPLQALVLLNDPQYVEASRALAEKMIRVGGTDLTQQIAYGFRALTSRLPDDRELRILEKLYHDQLMEFTETPSSADSLLQVGEYPADRSLPPVQLAALTVVTSALMNYDGTVYKR